MNRYGLRVALGGIVAALLLVLVGVSVRAAAPPLHINEVLVGNASTILDPDNTNFSSWIEVGNSTGSSINLANYTLRSLPDGATAWEIYVIPTGITIPAGGRSLFWADETGVRNHTQFELDMDGGEIALHAPDGSLLDHVVLGEQEPDVSYGRTPDGGDVWAFYDQPTPGAANTTPAFSLYDFAAAPSFTVPGGMHVGSQSVELSTSEAGAIIRYTLDGSKPTTASPVYQTGQPILIDRPTVVRARAFVAGKMAGKIVTHTYLIGISTTLPIVSIAIDPPYMWDNRIGIYVKGSQGVLNCGVKANLNRSWERPASIEYFEIGGDNKIRQDVGIEIHGNCSRNLDRKSLEVKARKLYGDNDMDYAFFGDKPMTDYKRLILRNAGQDSTRAMLRDAMVTSFAAGQMDLDWQTYRPAIVFINGQYWGIHDLREKMDETFVESNYGLDEDEFDMLDKNSDVMAGDTVAWNDFKNRYFKSNLTNPGEYVAIQADMDVSEFMNYLIVQMYAATIDWPGPNQRYWHERAPEGRWRWLLYDMDSAFRGQNLEKDMFKHIPSQGGNTSKLAQKLFTNPTFRAEFAQRFAVHLNTTFVPLRTIGIIDALQAEIAPEMANHIARWKAPSSIEGWNKDVQNLRVFAAARPEIVRNHVRKWVGSPGTATLSVYIVDNGHVLVAGAEVPNGYNGLHFRNVPMTLTAVPDSGAVFTHWLETGETTTTITIPFAGSTTRTAVFAEEPPPPLPPDLVLNEIHYQPSAPQSEANNEFVEIYNNEATVVDLSGFTIPAITYAFPPGSTIDPGEYIVVVANSADPAFAALDADDIFDFNWGSPDSQKLSNGGETVEVLDTFGQAADSVSYDDVAPWPTAPDGGGPSLSLLDPMLDNSAGLNWRASAAPGGTPGVANTVAP